MAEVTTDPKELLQQIDAEFGDKFKDLEGKAQEISEELDAARDKGDEEAQKANTKRMEELEETVSTLTEERNGRLREVESKAMKSRVESLEQALAQAKEPHEGFSLGGAPSTEEAKALYGLNREGQREQSFYGDVRRFIKENDGEAKERWEEALGEKAMTQGTGSAGGFLVPDQISGELLELRAQRAVLRSLFPSISVDSDTLIINSVTSGLTAGWVAELAEKPVADLAFAQLSTNVFTAAGLAVVSNQLLRNAQRSVDTLINRDLALRLNNVEEVALINGSGTGQPRGILNTSGINTVTYTEASPTVLALLDSIVDAITAIYSNYFASPNAIVMHPRTWARIVKARESGTSANYILGPGSNPFGRRSNDPLPGYTGAQTPRGELFGYPVYTTANIPTNLGAGVNESRVIVGNFDEGLILENQGITLDQSEHVYFTTNQTIFRAEEAVGFTAARYPKAFSVVQGTGLAAG